MANNGVISDNIRRDTLVIKLRIRSHLVGGGGGGGGGSGGGGGGGGGGRGGGGRGGASGGFLYGGIDFSTNSAKSRSSIIDRISVLDAELGSSLLRCDRFFGDFFSTTSIADAISNLASSSEPHALQLSMSSAEITSVPHIMHLYLYLVFSICADILFNFLDYTAITGLVLGAGAEDGVTAEAVCTMLFSSSRTT